MKVGTKTISGIYLGRQPVKCYIGSQQISVSEDQETSSESTSNPPPYAPH